MWKAVSSAVRSVFVRSSGKDAEATLEGAHEALRGMQASSSRTVPEVHDALQKPLVELSRLEAPELRKLGHAAYFGIGTDINLDRATELWVCASMKGCSESTYSVAMCMLEGKGRIPQDEERGMQLLEMLVKTKHPWAMFAVATTLMKEHNTDGGDPAMVRRAFDLFKAAGEAGVAPAFKNVANFYELGVGTDRDVKQAVEWLKKASQSGDPSAQVALGRKLTLGEYVTKNEEQGFVLFSRAAEAGHPAGVYNVGCAYLAGHGVGRDVAQAIKHFEAAAEDGFFPAQLNLANLYAKGSDGVPQNDDLALKWYSAALGETVTSREELIAKAQAALAEQDAAADAEAARAELNNPTGLEAPFSSVAQDGSANRLGEIKE